jgi:hypothetical protein
MRKHAFDPASFVLGLVITGVAVAYLVAEAQDRTVDGAWVLPLTLIGLGVAAVAAGLTRALRRTPAVDVSTPSAVEPAADSDGSVLTPDVAADDPVERDGV